MRRSKRKTCRSTYATSDAQPDSNGDDAAGPSAMAPRKKSRRTVSNSNPDVQNDIGFQPNIPPGIFNRTPISTQPTCTPISTLPTYTSISTQPTCTPIITQPTCTLPQVPNAAIHVSNPEGTGTLNDPQIQQVSSIHARLGLNVSQGTKNKITNGEYVELSNLLDSNCNHPSVKEEKTVVMIDGILTTKEKPKQLINSIEKWTDCFLVYISIYISVHPEKAQSLLKYMQTVRLGASRMRGLGWKEYDQQFRLKMAFDPSKSWDTVDNELWLMYMISDSITSNALSIPAPKSTGQLSTFNKCYNFNNKGSCFRNPCTYQHLCFKCSLPDHPFISCPHNKNQQIPSRSFRPRIPNQYLPSLSTRPQRYAQPRTGPSFQTPRTFGLRKFPN